MTDRAGVMISCEHVIARLWEFIDGELDAASEAEVQQHLELCERCFPQYDFQRAYSEFMRRVARRLAPPGLRRRIFEQLLAEEARQGLA
ncbi:MAG: zf-HC2 domain-containing protein [Longimicrobiales bacterium]